MITIASFKISLLLHYMWYSMPLYIYSFCYYSKIVYPYGTVSETLSHNLSVFLSWWLSWPINHSFVYYSGKFTMVMGICFSFVNKLQRETCYRKFISISGIHTVLYNSVIKWIWESYRFHNVVSSASDSVKHIILNQGGLRTLKENLKLKGLV